MNVCIVFFSKRLNRMQALTLLAVLLENRYVLRDGGVRSMSVLKSTQTGWIRDSVC